MSLSGDLASDQRSGAQQEDAPGRISMERRLPIFRLACVCFGVVVGHAGPIWEMPAFAVPTMLFPTDLASFLDLIRQHGDAAYSFMFAYAASHSLLLTLFAGYAAHSGALSFGTLIVVCGFGSFTGDVVRFWIGRRFGKRLLGSFPRLARTVQTAAQLAHRHHVWMILLHRYPHGIRGVAAFAYGMSPLPWSTFLVLNFVAAAIWSCAVVSAGYAFGQVSEKVMSDASSGLGFVMLCAFLGLSWFLSRRLERVLERS
jgi:membrane protein DedA with SNARE-associated domain